MKPVILVISCGWGSRQFMKRWGLNRVSRLFTHSTMIDTVWAVNKNADLLEMCCDHVKELEKKIEELEKKIGENENELN